MNNFVEDENTIQISILEPLFISTSQSVQGLLIMSFYIYTFFWKKKQREKYEEKIFVTSFLKTEE